ncbi:MAG TPA: CHAT domain-containing protein [Pseudolabrys sp.]|nr:CHAT domain-containing protein [Pseudolabrys sp.]
MTTKTAVINRTGDHEDNIVRWAKNLGTAKLRRKLFNFIYGRGSKPRSLKQLMTAASVKQRDAQQAQNEIEHLFRKDLIARMDNDGSVKDGTRYLYFKDDSVRAHKDEIIRAADNKKLRDSMPTKRAPKLNDKTVYRTVITRGALKKRKHIDVLYLMANPIRRHNLRVDAEIKAVNAEIQRSKFRDNITLHQSPAADFDDILHGLNDHRPRIVHFSGHGNAGGLAMDGGGMKRVKTKFVTFDLLGKALAATDNPPDVIVLNACQSASARKALLGTAKALIVMEDSVTDTAAVAFATKFYGAVASGLSLQAAFDQGCVAVEAFSLDEADTPALVTANGVNAKKLVLA